MTATKRILLVDDNLRDVEMTLDALGQHGLTENIAVLHDGAEALDYLYRRGEFTERPSGEPTVILLDLKMPKVDGLEVLRHVKSDPALRCIPVVVMTSSREECDLMESYSVGANAYVVKPLSFHEFSEAVKQVGAFWTALNEVPGGRPPEA